VPYSARTLKGTVSAPLTFYVRDVVDRLSNGLVPSVPVTSRSLWDGHLEAIGRSQKFTLNRFNYDAMADVLIPRAVGYAAGFLDAFFRGSVGAGFEDQRMTIWASTEVMEGTFQLLYDMDDGTRRELASWMLRIDPEGSSQVVAPQLPPEAGPGASCWLIFRGQLGDESGAVVGTRVGCPQAPTPPPHDLWVLYSCIYGAYENQTVVRYRYATTDPPLANDGLAIPRFFLKPTGGETVCSLLTLALPEQPPGSLLEHPF
jgi:hypothetical protein